jgi:hypothetical protein
MPNANKPFGFRPVGTLNGSPWSGSVRKYAVLAADTDPIYIGDPVMLGAGTLTTTRTGEVPVGVVTKLLDDTATTAVVGVVVGIEPLLSDLTVTYRKASTLMGVFVCTDPQAIYEVQGDADAIDLGDVGLNCGITHSTGSTTTGVSNAVLDQSDAATTTTLALQILGVSGNVGNDVASGAVYPVYLVKFNNHQFADNHITGVA